MLVSVLIVRMYSKTPYLHRGIVFAMFGVWKESFDFAPKAVSAFYRSYFVIGEGEVENGLIALLQYVGYSKMLAQIVFGISEQEVIDVMISTVKREYLVVCRESLE